MRLLSTLTASFIAIGAASSATACGPYTVALYEYGALYYKDPHDGRPRGVDLDVVNELARRSGCKLDTVLQARSRTWATFGDGQVDIATSALQLPERETVAEFVPYFRSHYFVLMRSDLAAALPTPEAFLADPQRRLVVVRSFRFTPQLNHWIEELRARKRVDEAADQPAAVRSFVAGRVDAIVTGAGMLALDSLREDGGALQQGYVPIDWSPKDQAVAALAISRKTVTPADAALLRRTVEDMLRDGTMDAILRRHVGETMARLVRAQPVATAR